MRANTTARLKELRHLLSKENIQGYIIPSEDPHKVSVKFPVRFFFLPPKLSSTITSIFLIESWYLLFHLQSEFVADHYKRRQYIAGFTGDTGY